MVYLLFAAGFILLVFGANFLVDGASSISKKLKISNLIIGLTVVAFGTSAPELVVTVLAGWEGANDIALGNVVGSNIFNVLFILGVAAIIYPLKVHKNTVFKEIPLALLSAILIFVLGSDVLLDGAILQTGGPTSQQNITGVLGVADGLVMLLFFGVFLFYAFAAAKGGENIEGEEIKQMPLPKALLMLALGLVGLVFGGKWVVNGAVEIAQNLGLSEKFIGLTIVSIGTSLPELATSCVAAYKKQSDIAIGNVVGSNIFNAFFILGVGATMHPINISGFSYMDIMVNIVSSLLLFGLLFVGKRNTIGRFEGVVFLLGYVLYTVYLFVRG